MVGLVLNGPVTGRNWTFTTADCMSAENFDAYIDDAGLMAAWVDNIPDRDYVFLATDRVGNNSICFELQNQFEPYFTEATRTFDSPQDWTVHGIEALSLSFIGKKENSEHLMYLILEDAAGQSLKVEHPFTHACQFDKWRQWAFALGQFSYAGVDLSSVKKCTIGFGDGTNSGQTGDDMDIVFIDDINLCPPGSYLTSPYVKWENGPLHIADFFPIAVWLQNPVKASRYRMAGFNTFVGLWRGPTEIQLEELKTAGMKVICHQNELALKYIDEPTIIGWMHGDEPDNAQTLGNGEGYGPPIQPQQIIDDYNKILSVDPTRPVFLNLSQGVAWDGWYGRGVRTNHPEDYLEYVKGCDIASFDIYPVVHSNPQVAGNLWYVARGVERLKKWTDGKKVVWNCIECTRINNKEAKATPKQVKCEVWMSLIHGSMGLIYFVHEWQPQFNESALLSDEEMLSAVTEINKQINELAPVLNSPTIDGDLSVSSDNEEVPVAVMVKEYKGAKYLFAVGMRDGKTNASFTVPALKDNRTIEVLGENRTILSQDGVFNDTFEAWDVHLYRVEDIYTN